MMTAPVAPQRQDLLYRGGGVPWVMGAVGSRLYAQALDAEVSLWRVGTTPTQVGSAVMASDQVRIAAVNSYGAMMVVLSSGTPGGGRLCRVGIENFQIELTEAASELPFPRTDIVGMWVSEDSRECVVLQDDGTEWHIWGYDSADGGYLYDYQLWELDGRSSGEVVGAPSAGRLIVRNTSPELHTYALIPSLTGGPLSFSGTITVPDLTGETVVACELWARFRYNGEFGGPSPLGRTGGVSGDWGASGSVDLDDTSVPEGATFYWIGGPVVASSTPSAGSHTITAVASEAPWTSGGSPFAGLDIVVDNASRGGGGLQLRNNAGAVLSTLPFDDPRQLVWSGAGIGQAAYFDKGTAAG